MTKNYQIAVLSCKQFHPGKFHPGKFHPGEFHPGKFHSGKLRFEKRSI